MHAMEAVTYHLQHMQVWSQHLLRGVWPTLQVLEAATGIALSSCICYVGQQLAAAMGYPSASISVITLLTVILATCMPRRLAPLVPSSEGIAYILLQVTCLPLRCTRCHVAKHASFNAILESG